MLLKLGRSDFGNDPPPCKLFGIHITQIKRNETIFLLFSALVAILIVLLVKNPEVLLGFRQTYEKLINAISGKSMIKGRMRRVCISRSEFYSSAEVPEHLTADFLSTTVC